VKDLLPQFRCNEFGRKGSVEVDARRALGFYGRRRRPPRSIEEQL
jgi:hypothetical protein